MPDRVWYYASGGQRRGPVKTADLKRLATAGDLRPSDLVWTDNMANWAPASTVKGLFPAELVAAVAAPAETLAAHEAEAEVNAAAAANVNPPVVVPATEERHGVARAPREAWAALRMLIIDPWSRLGTVYEHLGPKRAIIVGGAFMATFFVCCALAVVFQQTVLLPGVVVLASIEAIPLLKAALVLIGYAAGMIGAVTVFRILARTGAGLAADVFVVGAAQLPIGIYVAASGLLNPLSSVVQWILSVLFVFAAVTAVLMLYNGLKQPVGLRERIAALAVPTVLAAAMTVAQILQWLLAKLPV